MTHRTLKGIFTKAIRARKREGFKPSSGQYYNPYAKCCCAVGAVLKATPMNGESELSKKLNVSLSDILSIECGFCGWSVANNDLVPTLYAFGQKLRKEFEA